jgi:hypothetical protein
MYDGPSLVRCGRCCEHVRVAERVCPHCGAPRYAPGSADARVLRAVAAAATFGMIGTVACAAYGVPGTETQSDSCDDPSRTCASCLECATPAKDRGDNDDAADCAREFELCFGDDRDCSASDASSCCQFTACRAACDDLYGSDSSAAWQCICGSNSRGACDTNQPPDATCASENVEGARRTLGTDGWQTCVHAACVVACSD